MKLRSKHLLIGGGAALAGYLVYRRSQSAALSGFGEMTETEFSQALLAAQANFNQLVASNAKLQTDQPASYETYRNTLSAPYTGISTQLQQAQQLAQSGNLEGAGNMLKAANVALAKVGPLIAADLQKAGSAQQITQQRLDAIAAQQAANEPERELAEKGAVPYIFGKTGEAIGGAVGGAAGGIGEGIKQFLKQIPWWVYVVGAGGLGVYFFWPVIPTAARVVRKRLSARAIKSLAGESDQPERTEYVFSNPRRRRARRR